MGSFFYTYYILPLFIIPSAGYKVYTYFQEKLVCIFDVSFNIMILSKIKEGKSMTEKQMEKLYDFLIEYRKKEIKRSSDFEDKYRGTNIEYYIGDYCVKCNFFNMGQKWDPLAGSFVGEDVWELCITPELAHNFTARLGESARFTSADLYNVITDHLDDLFATLIKMGPYIEQLKAKFAETLAGIH